MNYTFALLKPDVATTQKETAIIKDLKAHGFLIAAKKRIKKPSAHIVATHLEELRTKIPEAFDRNFATLLEGPVTILQLAHRDKTVDPITELRILAGATDPKKAAKGTLRKKYGTDTIAQATREKRGLRNAIHCSDSETTANEEINLWFHGETKTIPKHEFYLVDNKGGDILNIRFLSIDQVEVSVSQCCVPRYKAELPISLLIDLLVLWENGQHKSDWQGTKELWKPLQDRIKIQGKTAP